MSYIQKNIYENFELSENRLSDSLKDAGCDIETIINFTQMFKEENFDEEIRILQQQRLKLLDSLHCVQKQIDCLDYLLYIIKKLKSK